MASKIQKTYVTPQLSVYGDIQKITKQNGSQAVDMPIGTPATTPGGVVGDPTS